MPSLSNIDLDVRSLSLNGDYGSFLMVLGLFALLIKVFIKLLLVFWLKSLKVILGFFIVSFLLIRAVLPLLLVISIAVLMTVPMFIFCLLFMLCLNLNRPLMGVKVLSKVMVKGLLWALR